MNPRLQEIAARLDQIAAELQKMGAELTAEVIDELEQEVATLEAERDTIQRSAQKRSAILDSIAKDGGSADGKKAAVVRSFNPDPEKKDPEDRYDTTEYRKAFMNYVLKGTPIPMEYRANAITMTTDIGSVIPKTVLDQIIEKLESTGMIMPLCTHTAYKGGLEIPTSTVKPVATWVNEGKGSDKQKKSTGSISFAYHKLRCAVAVSLEVDTMAMSVFETTLINNVVEAMIKGIEQAIVNGTGTGQPKGILTETPVTGQALTTNKLSYDDLIAAESALPLAYESGAVYCMTKKTFMQFYAITDVNGQPIARVNYGIAGKPDRTLLGRSVVLCDYLPSFDASLATGTKFAFLFDFKDYVMNTNYAMGIKRYEDNDTDDQVTKAIMLVDGKVIENGSLVTLAKKA